MKTLTIISLILFSMAASAGQTIHCFEVNKNGSRRVNGGSLKAALVFTSRGSLSHSKSNITMKGFWKKGAEYGKEFTYLVASQSEANSVNKWTTLFFNDAANGELVEYQLQFREEAILEQSFSNKKASLVIGIENNSSEYYPSFGHDLKCSARVN